MKALEGDHEWIEENLIQLEKKYQRIFNIAPVSFWPCNVEATEVYLMSPGTKALTGYEVEEFIKNPSLWFLLTLEQDRDIVLGANERTGREKVATTFECRIRHRDRSI